MSDKTGIEWTDATWNPVTGCNKVSSGCDNCYAETLAERFRGTPGHYYERGFDVQLRPEKLDQPLRWKRPRRVFVNSMSDLFHDQVPDEYIARVFAVMAISPRHTFQVLTKRHARMRSLLTSGTFQTATAEHMLAMTDADEMKDAGEPFPMPNVWLGVSAENQQWADIRIPALLDTPAAVRFISAEPLLGPVDLTRHLVCPDCTAFHGWCECRTTVSSDPTLDWVIVGGESGRGARPMHPDWARGLRDQCESAGVAFHFKQHGEWTAFSPPADSWVPDTWVNRATGECLDEEKALRDGGLFTGVWRVGKKAAGRELDGRNWNQYPEVVVG